jgi:hypothetical protein
MKSWRHHFVNQWVTFDEFAKLQKFINPSVCNIRRAFDGFARNFALDSSTHISRHVRTLVKLWQAYRTLHEDRQAFVSREFQGSWSSTRWTFIEAKYPSKRRRDSRTTHFLLPTYFSYTSYGFSYTSYGFRHKGKLRVWKDTPATLRFPVVIHYLGSTQPLKMSTRKTPGGKDGRCVRVTTLPPSWCRKSGKSGALTYWNPLVHLGVSRDTFNTRRFKYDQDKLWLVYKQIVPVIFEPPCTLVINLQYFAPSSFM